MFTVTLPGDVKGLSERRLASKFLLVLSVLTLLVFFIVSGAFSILFADETLGPITNTGKRGSFVSVAVDSGGDIHLCYWRAGTAYYLFQKNGAWQNEKTVNGSAGQAGSGFYPHFVLDSNENAYFSWTVGAGGPVKYVKYNAGSNSWSSATNVIRDTVSGSDTNRNDICLCPNGDLHVVAQSDWAIQWNRKFSGGSWLSNDYTIYGIAPGGSEPIFPQIACGSNNEPVLVFSNYFMSGSNKYIAFDQRNSNPPPQWRGTSPSSQLDGIPNANSIFIDGAGNVHVTWIEWTSSEQYNRIGYLKRNGLDYNSSWDAKKTIYYQPLIVAQDPVPAPRVAANSKGDVIVVFARYAAGIKEVMYLLKESTDADWPPYDFFNLPPKIDTGLQAFPGVAVDPTNDDFVVGWESEPGTQPGYVKVRRITVQQQVVPSLSWFGLFCILSLISIVLGYYSIGGEKIIA